ncbi:MAG: hypothetical protein E7300_07915 [Lachnospiraceae bacterium]|nr:hypothetical protein [Lachnospiraceae bacterium]
MRLYEKYNEINQGFKRRDYEKSFQEYLDTYQTDLADIRARALSENSSEEIPRIADEIVAEAKSILDAETSKLAKETVRINLNMYTVTFLLPALVSFGEQEMKPLTDAICAKWAEVFKNSNIRATTRDHIQSGFKTKLCYITTAVCENLHKGSDCRELHLLKEYRDGFLMHEEGGKELIDTYYDIAPTIVKRIEKSGDRDAVYHMLWEQYISPCVSMIEEDRNEECRVTYETMVNALRKKYMEDYQ